LKAEILEYKLDERLGTDYIAANARFSAGAAAYGSDNAAAKVAYEEAIKLFSDILARGLPLVLESEKAEASKLKAAAEYEFAQLLFADLYSTAEARYLLASDAEASADIKGAIKLYRSAKELFGILYGKARAAGLMAIIAEKGYAEQDRGNYELAEAKYLAIDSNFDVDNNRALNDADEAILRFNLVIDRGLEIDVLKAREKADSAKKEALASQADSLAAEEFAAGLESYAEAEALQKSGDRAQAVEGYSIAADRFLKARDAAMALVSLEGQIATLRGTALEAKAKADEVKAPKAAAPEYAEAEAVLAEAEAFAAQATWKEAAGAFERARAAYLKAYEIANEKRVRAEKALEAALKKLQESEEKAKAGDAFIQGPSSVGGGQ
jgi:hypothetical protein